MGFIEAIQSGFQNYVNFNGRASRSEFWFWVLFVVLVAVVAAIIGNILHTKAISNLVSLAFLLPGIALAIRRLHDTDRSGWWYLLSFTIIGLIPLIIWYCLEGTPHANRFGDNPLGGTGLPSSDPQRIDARTGV